LYSFDNAEGEKLSDKFPLKDREIIVTKIIFTQLKEGGHAK
jgi:hypothetical protein